MRLHNLQDHLDPAETRDLAGFIEQWWDRTILRFTAERLWLEYARSRDATVREALVHHFVPFACSLANRYANEFPIEVPPLTDDLAPVEYYNSFGQNLAR